MYLSTMIEGIGKLSHAADIEHTNLSFRVCGADHRIDGSLALYFTRSFSWYKKLNNVGQRDPRIYYQKLFLSYRRTTMAARILYVVAVGSILMISAFARKFCMLLQIARSVY
jgi:hypothetical protein